MWSINYTVSDIQAGQIDPAALHAEIAALGLRSARLIGVRVRGDRADGTSEVYIVWDAELSGADQTTLAAAVRAHSGTRAPEATRLQLPDGRAIEISGFAGGSPTWKEVT